MNHLFVKANSASRGIWIAFFGPDGVGKSAAIELLAQRLECAFHGVRTFHFRPMFGRDRHQPAVTTPHAQPMRGTAISLLKLLYWFADCWYGYMVTVRPAVRRGGLVMFDRYYPDMLIDRLRYRLPKSSMGLARVLAALVPQPDLYVLLDAPAEVVQRRKNEVAPAECERQRGAYLRMFQAVPHKLVVSADRPVDEVAACVARAICETLITFTPDPAEPAQIADI